MKKKQKVPRCEMLWLDRSLSQIAYLLFILEETKKKSEYVKSEIPSAKVIQSNERAKKTCNSVYFIIGWLHSLPGKYFLYKSWTNHVQAYITI